MKIVLVLLSSSLLLVACKRHASAIRGKRYVLYHINTIKNNDFCTVSGAKSLAYQESEKPMTVDVKTIKNAVVSIIGMIEALLTGLDNFSMIIPYYPPPLNTALAPLSNVIPMVTSNLRNLLDKILTALGEEPESTTPSWFG